MAQSEHWDSRTAFILAAIGSAIGLGNIWRFPYIAYRYGGGAFIIPYFVALFTAGIPLLILEFALGHKTEKSAPYAFSAFRDRWKWAGWLAVFVGFGIVTYYAVIMAWSFDYFIYSFKLSWGVNPANFFKPEFLQLSQNPFHIGTLRGVIVIGLVITWIWIYFSIIKGAKSVGKVVYITVIVPWIVLLILFLRGITLPGAKEGLRYFLTPNFAALKDPAVWFNAYSQIFFTLSIGFGVMIAYASFLPRKSDIINNAFIIALSNCATSFIGGLTVFSTLGYLAYQKGVAVSSVVTSGPGLAFITYPTVINLFPFARPFFGAIFFLMLLTLGIDSAFSLVEAFSAAVMDKWKVRRPLLNGIITAIALIIGLLFATHSGLYWLDIFDHYLATYGLVIAALLETIFVAYVIGPELLRNYANQQSDFSVGKWWTFMLKIVIPLTLLWVVIWNVKDEVKTSYGGYTKGALGIGLLFLGILFIMSFVFSKERRK